MKYLLFGFVLFHSNAFADYKNCSVLLPSPVISIHEIQILQELDPLENQNIQLYLDCIKSEREEHEKEHIKQLVEKLPIYIDNCGSKNWNSMPRNPYNSCPVH